MQEEIEKKDGFHILPWCIYTLQEEIEIRGGFHIYLIVLRIQEEIENKRLILYFIQIFYHFNPCPAKSGYTLPLQIV